MKTEEIVEKLKKYGWQMGLIVVGIVMMTGGIIAAQKQTMGNELKIIEPSPLASGNTLGVTQAKELVVDIEGAVEKPGVYKLQVGARVSDAIIAAGGLSAQADRSFVARFINQAEVVKDGGKLYIPEVGESTESMDSNNKYNVSNQGGIISINTARESELDSLWGIGAARAKAIVENRPYGSLDELVTKAKISQEVLDKNQGKMGL